MSLLTAEFMLKKKNLALDTLRFKWTLDEI